MIMIIIAEKKKPKNEASDWRPSSREELSSNLRRFSSRRVSIFKVGPDQYFIQEGRFIGKNQGIHYYMDRNGFIGGFDVRTLGDRIEVIEDVMFSAFIGNQEVQIIFE
jgi:hypothetical protein